MFLDFSEFVKNLDGHHIYLIFGEEDFLIDDHLSKIHGFISEYPNSSYDFESIDTDTTPISKITNICSSYPMICDRKFVLVRNFEKLLTGRASKKNDDNFPLKNILESPPSFLNLIITAKIDKIKDLRKFVKNKELTDLGLGKLKDIKYPFDYIIKNHSWIEFPKIYESDYPIWIVNKIKDYKKTIRPQAAQLLSLQVRSSLRDLDSEIGKLVLYAHNKTEITEDDIYDLTGATKEYNVFELQKAISTRDLSKSITILIKILSIDRQEMLIITILMKFFTNMFKFLDLLKIAGDESILAKEMGLQKWQLQEYQLCAGKYKPEEIEKAIMILTDCDFSLKSGNSDSLAILQNSLIEIIKSN